MLSTSNTMGRKRNIQMTALIGKRRRVGSSEMSSAEQNNSDASLQRGGTDTKLTADDVVRQRTLDPSGPESPDLFLRKLVSSQFGIEINDNRLPCDAIGPEFFDRISEEEMSYYTVAVATAVRGNDVEEIKKLQESGLSLNCCNRFGESLLHISCRRGFVEMAKLILNQPGASVRLSDDCGRTPLHDLCWNPSPQLEICQWLLEREPSLFFMRDKRNFTPFEYARQEHWPIWKKFILENKDAFKALKHDSYSFLRGHKDASIIG
jgi:hypothetical protein